MDNWDKTNGRVYRIEYKGAPREGLSLLAGLVVCGRCGKRMTVHYAGGKRTLRYTCRTGVGDGRGTCRQGLAGRVLDHFIACQVLAALRPGAVELSLSAADDVMRERSALDENWRQRLERARTQATRIERQYQAAEPDYAQSLIMPGSERPGLATTNATA